MAKELQVEPWHSLESKVASEVLRAPKTCGDLIGEWQPVHQDIVKYLANTVAKYFTMSWLNHLALTAAIVTAQRLALSSVVNIVSTINCRLTDIFSALEIRAVDQWNGAEHMRSYLEGEIVSQDNDGKRVFFWFRYSQATKRIWKWFKSLSESEQQIYQQFLLPLIPYEQVEDVLQPKCKEVLEQQRANRKSATAPKRLR